MIGGQTYPRRLRSMSMSTSACSYYYARQAMQTRARCVRLRAKLAGVSPCKVGFNGIMGSPCRVVILVLLLALATLPQLRRQRLHQTHEIQPPRYLPSLKPLVKSNFWEMSEPIVLKNSKGVEVHILAAGAVIQRLYVPDRLGKLEDIVLGFDSSEPYIDGTSPYFGAIVGRVANRIANATFTLDGKVYKLAANNGPNCLHGGVYGFNRKMWKVVENGRGDEGPFVKLAYESCDGDEGFPGNLSVFVTYTLTEGNDRLITHIQASSDALTPINIAQHSYFNLKGHDAGDVLGHELMLVADHWTPVNEVQIPTGAIEPVAHSAMDFTSPHGIGDRISRIPGPDCGGYDHNYVLFGLGPAAKSKVAHGMAYEVPRMAAEVRESISGRGLRVATTAPGIQFYSGNFLDGTIVGKGGAVYPKHGGLCLETQGFPDAVNQRNFPSVAIQPGETYTHIIHYDFFTFPLS